jgi:ABC-type arginine/histidine transport system permease subunit
MTQFQNNKMRLNKLYNYLLIASSLLIWLFMTGVKHSAYDTNVLFLICAALLSITVSLLILVMAVFKRQTVKESLLVTILFMLTSSPLSIYFFIEYIGIDAQK